PLHLPVNIRIHAARASVSGKTPVDSGGYGSPSNIGELPELRDFREGLEEKYLQNLIGQTKGNMKKACVVSGLSRSRLYALLKKHEIRPFHSLVTPTQAP
ncbi:MAG: hypothetical protein SV775_16215, partial [Thermodesulfobacteriota bacterium]|nr:hypothetical protein [Thermodesulfobacteriota bacterium]